VRAPARHGGGVPAPELAREKAALRRRVLAARDALPADVRQRLSATIGRRLAELAAFRRAGLVLGYVGFGSEPDTRPWLGAVLETGRGLLLPRVDRARRRLELYHVADLGQDLRPGVWGIAEPDPARCRPAGREGIDFVLVPGVAFDVRGGRVGYGGGYYDGLLAGWPSPPLLVAAAFELQVVPAVPMGPGDRRVDRVVTEARTYPEEGP
jgi:5-formyltetrahydrofolate cyclo-ligase